MSVDLLLCSIKMRNEEPVSLLSCHLPSLQTLQELQAINPLYDQTLKAVHPRFPGLQKHIMPY